MAATDTLQALLRSGGHTELLNLVTSEKHFMSLAKKSSFAMGKSPVHLAVATGSIDIVKQLGALGFNLNAVEVLKLESWARFVLGDQFTYLHFRVQDSLEATNPPLRNCNTSSG
jgi:hypothetical protein